MRTTATILVAGVVAVAVGCGQASHSPAESRGAVQGAVHSSAAAGAPLVRAITRTGSMTVRVRSVVEAARAAVATAERAGGYLQAEESTLPDHAALTLRVRPDRFTAVGDELAGLGTLLRRTVSSDDVTETVADVRGRLAAARASTQRLRGLLDRAGSVADIATIESSVSDRESEIESLEARQRALADETSYATIVLSLERPVAVAGAPHGFSGGLRAGWRAFTAMGAVLLVVAGALLPFALAAAVVVAPFAGYVRRRRRSVAT